MPSVPAYCSEYGKASGSERARFVFHVRSRDACRPLHFDVRRLVAACRMRILRRRRSNSPGMPSNSRRYLFPFVRSNGTALRSVLRLLFEHSRHAAAAALGADLGAFARERLAEATLTAAHSHRHAPPPCPLGAPVGSSSTARATGDGETSEIGTFQNRKLPKSTTPRSGYVRNRNLRIRKLSETFRTRNLPNAETSEIGTFRTRKLRHTGVGCSALQALAAMRAVGEVRSQRKPCGSAPDGKPCDATLPCATRTHATQHATLPRAATHRIFPHSSTAGWPPTDDVQWTTCNGRRATDNRRQATDNMQRTTDNMQQTTCNRQRAADDRQHATDDRHWTAESQRRAACDRPTSSDGSARVL